MVRRSTWVALTVGALIGLALLCVAAWAIRQDKPTQPNLRAASVGNQIGTVGGDVNIVYNTTSSQTPPQLLPQQTGELHSRVTSKLHKLFREGLIGNDVQWFDSIAGPPMRKSEYGLREYEVDECKVDLKVLRNQTIVEAKLYVSSDCTFAWENIQPNLSGLPPPHALHFGDVMAPKHGSWSLAVSCLATCGNAEAPYVEITFGGSHAHDWVATTIGAWAGSEVNNAAWQRLSDKVEAAVGRRAVMTGTYACDYDISAAAVGMVERMKVSYVAFSSTNDIVPSEFDGPLGCVQDRALPGPPQTPAQR